MKLSKKKKSEGNSTGEAQRFLIWHGEKIVVGIVVVVALWFALQGLGYQTLSWQPDDLVQKSSNAETNIKNSKRTAEDEFAGANPPIVLVDYAAYAEQIKEPIPAEPYRSESQWNAWGSILSGSARTSTPQPQN